MAILIFSLLAFCGSSWAAPESTKEKTQATQPAGTVKKSTDMSFDELLVQGKYHFTDEAVTTVEQDKVLDGLLQVRKDFKDRIQQSAARY
jgi:RNase H-fold protein (predicted Holliday junction resolvase)